MAGKIDVEKDPALAYLGAGDEAELRAPPQFLRVHFEKTGGLEERQGLHFGSAATRLGIA
jgi:hypothetical protein